MPSNEYISIIISSASVYLFIIIALRIFGKKELSQLSVIDLVFILLISNAVQNAMVGANTTLAGGLTAAATLFLMNFTFKDLMYRFPRLSRFVQGEAIMLIYNGELNKQNLKKSKISIDEIEEAIREHGVGQIQDVNLAVLEVDGNISVLSDNYNSKTVKKRRSHKTIHKNT